MITLDSVATSINTGFSSASNTYTWTHTIGGANPLLVLCVSWTSVPADTSHVSVATFNGVSLTQISSVTEANAGSTSTIVTEMWYIAAPFMGSYTVSVTITAGSTWDRKLATSSFNDVDQNSPLEQSTTAVGQNVATLTTSATTTTDNDLLLTGFGHFPTTQTVSTNQTPLVNDKTGSNTIFGVSYQAAGAVGTYSNVYTISGHGSTDANAQIMAAFKPLEPVHAQFVGIEDAAVRKIAHNVQVAWKKDFRPGISLFTIGVSAIQGNDYIGGPAGIQSAWQKYLYNDESDKTISLSWERALNMPLGGLTKAQADVRLDNTSGRYTPRYAGGNSEIFTAIQPRRPLIINAGFNYGGVDNTIPQFVGITDKQVKLDVRSKTADLHAFDFINFLQNQYVDKTAMFTTETTDVVIENLLTQAGFATAQYDLDPGINVVKFGLFNQGDKFADLIDELVKSEYGHLYQDAEGRLRFENRQHWAQFPHYNVQRIIATSQVINANVPNTDHIINVVEVKASPREVKPTQIVWQATGYSGSGIIAIEVGDTEVWANYNDPIFEIDRPVPNGTTGQTSFWIANTKTDGTGSNVTSSVTLKSITNFAQASKLVFTSSASAEIYLTTLDIWGKPARKTGDIHYKTKTDSSVTAYEEQPLVVENNYIQDKFWARTYAELILQDFAQPENLLELSIRAIPELEMGDQVSYGGRHYFVYGIASQLDPSVGFIQNLKLLGRTIRSYIRIGISTIGGDDAISP